MLYVIRFMMVLLTYSFMSNASQISDHSSNSKVHAQSTDENLSIVITAWQQFLTTFEWKQYIHNIHGEACGCGDIYELPNFLCRPGESIAIADMSKLLVSEPHYHPTGCTEIYIVLQGTALVVVGENQQHVAVGDVIVIHENLAHFTIPQGDFVIAVINSPAFRLEDYILLSESNLDVKFDRQLFTELVEKYSTLHKLDQK